MIENIGQANAANVIEDLTVALKKMSALELYFEDEEETDWERKAKRIYDLILDLNGDIVSDLRQREHMNDVKKSMELLARDLSYTIDDSDLSEGARNKLVEALYSIHEAKDLELENLKNNS